MNSSIYSFISKYFKANCFPAKLKQLRDVLHAPVCWCTLMVQHRDKQKIVVLSVIRHTPHSWIIYDTVKAKELHPGPSPGSATDNVFKPTNC